MFIIHHTDCGMLTFSNDDIRAKIKADLGDAAADKAAQVCNCRFMQQRQQQQQSFDNALVFMIHTAEPKTPCLFAVVLTDASHSCTRSAPSHSWTSFPSQICSRA